MVIPADAAIRAPRDPGSFDILQLASFASVAIDEGGEEHWLLSDGRTQIRLDIGQGSLVGCPVLLEYRLQGLQQIQPKLEALRRLVAAAATSRLGRARRECRTFRWIAELVTADALRAGATQREIAQRLFGNSAEIDWRRDSDAYRVRVQRLARVARMRLTHPLAYNWFGEVIPPR